MVKMDNSNLFTQDEGEDFTKEGGGYQLVYCWRSPHVTSE